ncbi:ABC transporter C family member 3 [Nymphaea thermarum]|nr:ABC transporter C family member 3 [Nymphaea thermarum]
MNSSSSAMFRFFPDHAFNLMKTHYSRSLLLAFSPVFRHFLSSGSHLLFIFLLISDWFFRRQTKAVSSKGSGVYLKLSVACASALCFFFGFLAGLNCLNYWDGGSLEFISTQVDFLVQVASWCAVYVALKHRVSERRFPMLLRVWWTVFFIISLYGSGVHLFKFERDEHFDHYAWVDYVSTIIGLLLCYISIFGETGIKEGEDEGPLSEPLLNGFTEKKDVVENASHFANASLFSILTFSWIGPLLSLGNQKTLDLKDVPKLGKNDSAKFIFPAFRDGLSDARTVENFGTLDLVKSLFFTVWKEVLSTALLCLLYNCASLVGPYLIDSLVQYLNGEHRYASEGYVLVSVFVAAKVIECFSQRHWFFWLQTVGIRNRAALDAMIYMKGLSLSTQARQGRTSGEIINLMSVDAERVGEFGWYMHDIWMVPIQVALALVILYKDLGVASIAALLATVAIMLANLPLGKLQEGFQDKIMESKDERMKATSEILRNMRILKLQGWEMRFLQKIMELRKKETFWLKKSLYTSAMVTFSFWGAPTFISVVSFGACLLLGIPLKAGRILSALATFRVLQEPICQLPDTISVVVQTKVSLDRIASFLRLEEIQRDAVEKSANDPSAMAVEICDGVFSWDPSSVSPTLKDLNLHVHHGMKVAVCGTVGSGKSSFLSCILGEVPKVSGSIRLSGKTAYVAQSPWIQSGTIEDNILFGGSKDGGKYDQVLEVCALKKDLEVLPFGDQTVIGERGINLSGGQKQRIQIARAIYQDADIYLFDDPFSAVDAHTGTHLFQECLLGFLNSKTVLYVTHQVEFLPAADLILVMKDGKITQAGTYVSILTSGTDFEELVGAHKQALSAVDAIKSKTEPRIKEEHGSSMTYADASGANQNGQHAKTVESEESDNQKEAEEKKGQLVEEEERETGSVGFSVYWEYMKSAYGGALVPFILLSQVLFQLFQIGSNYWMAWATPVSEDEQSQVSTFTVILVYVALALASSLCVLSRVTLLVTAGYKAAIVLFEKMHNCIFRAPMSFFDATPTGRMINRASTDQSTVDTSILFFLGSSAFSIIQLLGIIAVMSQVAWQIFIIFIPVIAVCLWLQQYYIPAARELSRLGGVCAAPLIQHFAETLAGSATIRSFDQESRFIETNFELVDQISRPKFHIAGAMEWLCFRLELLSACIFAFSLIFLILLPKGVISPGIAGLSVTYGLNLNMLQMWVVWNLCILETKIISVERILQYTRIPSEPPLVIETNRPSTSWPSHGEIAIRDLQVRYAPHLPLVLRGLTCTLHGGSKIGVVGRTGSGKSTLVQTLFRIIDPTGGHIMIDGVDIYTIGLHDLRSRLSIIPQDPTMFEGTIRSNLDPLEDYMDQEIWEALERCQLGDIVRQKEGKLDSIVAENGENWSVGQRQLVCLGRVLLKRSKVLVLDEATASVDTATDSLIQQTLRQEFPDCTVITIAHRIASVLDSDMVLLLDNGKIAEYDSPTKLLEDGSSAFARLVTEYTMRSSRSTNKLNQL